MYLKYENYILIVAFTYFMNQQITYSKNTTIAYLTKEILCNVYRPHTQKSWKLLQPFFFLIVFSWVQSQKEVRELVQS